MTSRRRPSVRGLATILLVALAATGVAVIAGFAWVSSLLERTGSGLVRDARSMELITESEVTLLAYQQFANLELLSRDPDALAEARAARAALESELRAVLELARQYVASGRELELLDETEARIAEYMLERVRLEEERLPLGDVLSGARPLLERALASIHLLRELNEQEVERAYGNAREAGRRLRLIALGTAAGALLLLTAIALWTRNALLAPIVAIRDAIAGYGEGHLPPLPREMPRELAEISAALETMSESLRRRREEQMAFLAGVAHELRNPLAALGMSAAALERTVSEAGMPAVGILKRQLAHLARLVDDLLEVGRIEAGELKLERSAFDLRHSVASVVELYGSAASRHVLETELPEEPVLIEGDAQRVEQVIGNLLSNAIKYSPDGCVVRLAVRATAEEASVAVTDRGVGIAPEELPELFRPFRRSARARGGPPGAGLGLAVVKRIVDAHGGAIDVATEEGRGSTFTVRLPRR